MKTWIAIGTLQFLAGAIGTDLLHRAGNHCVEGIFLMLAMIAAGISMVQASLKITAGKE